MFSEPAIKEKFFGREDLLSLLHKRASAFENGYRQNIAILGRQFLGKTSLTLQFLSQLKAKSNIIPVYIEINSEPFRFFVQKFLGVFLYHYIKTIEDNPLNDFEFLLKKCRIYAVKTHAYIKRILSDIDKFDNDKAFSKLLELPAVFNAETNKLCLVILDEFQNLEALKINSPFQTLSNAIMMQKTTMYIITSSWQIKAKKILAEKLSLLFGNFEILHVNYFDMKTSKIFLERKLHDVEIADIYKKFLYSLTLGHPFYLDLISENLKQIAQEDRAKKITTKSIATVLNNLLFDPRGILYQYFTNNIGRLLENHSYSTYSLILNALVDENKKSQNISKYANRSIKDISCHLNLLSEMEIIERKGTFNQLGDPMLKLWLKFVYKKRQQNFAIDPENLSVSFNNAIEEDFALFSELDRKNLADITTNLFQRFNNEIVDIGTKRFKLAKFDAVKLISQENFSYLIAAPKMSQNIWLCLFESSTINEQYLTDFIKHIKKFKEKSARKIIIALGGLDVNARLKALNEKFVIWGIDEFNMLLALYDINRIVRW